ncbi:MAG TPA: carboxypeptidase-like regulatory domain-containing protein [Verrucomicrobiae bacterium]|nr:carboxypeptidase-like regulatory domain-containing protein [Verrucomicrobiae bacterium]
MRKRLFYLWLVSYVVANLFTARAAIVSGLVKDESGSLIAEVRLEAGNDNGIWFTRTFSSSSFELDLIPGEWRVSLFDGRSAGYLDLDYLINVGSAAITTNLVFPKLNAVIEGSIRTASGVALTNVQIDFRRMMGTRQLWETARSDSNGMFTARLPDGQWNVRPQLAELSQVYDPIPAQVVTVLGDTNSQVLFVARTATNFIRGRIVDESGAPVTNLTVAAWVNYEASRQTTTDATGYYTIGVYPGYWMVEAQGVKDRGLIARMEHYVAEITESIGEATVDMRLHRAPFTIDVTTVDENGQLLVWTNMAVIARGSIGGDWAEVSATVVDGKASVAVPSGAWGISVGFFGLPHANPWPGTISMPNAVVTTESVSVKVVMRPKPADGRFNGRIVDEYGNGMANFPLFLSWETVARLTDGAGRFDFILPTGSYFLKSADTNYAFADGVVQVLPDSPVERQYVARRLGSELIVRVNYPPGIVPSYASVNAQSRLGGGSFFISATPEGGLARMRLFPGEWKLSAYATSLHTPTEQTVVVPTTNEITFDFAVAETNLASIQGHVVDSENFPLRWRNVGADAVRIGTDQRTDEDGRFRLMVAPGKVELWIPGPLPLITYKVYDVKPGENLDIGTLRLPRPGTRLTLNYVDENGAPLKLSGYSDNSVNASAEIGGVVYKMNDSGYENSRNLLLLPAKWRIEFRLREENLAAPAPMAVEVGETDLSLNVVVRKLSSTPTPLELQTVAVGGKSVLRLSTQSERYVDVESSADLKTWRFHSSHRMTNSVVNLNVSDSTNDANHFFRAVTAMTPAY